MSDLHCFACHDFNDVCEEHPHLYKGETKMTNVTETKTVVVEAVNSKPAPKFAKFNAGGILVEGKWINVAKNVKMSNFSKGQSVSVVLETNEKGYETIVGIEQEQTSVVPEVKLPSVPSLPKTTVSPKIDPNGVSPVRRPNENGSLGIEDKMTKKDWQAKDRRIETQAVLKSTLESPMLANLIIGKNEEEALQMFERLFERAMNIYDRSLNA